MRFNILVFKQERFGKTIKNELNRKYRCSAYSGTPIAITPESVWPVELHSEARNNAHYNNQKETLDAFTNVQPNLYIGTVSDFQVSSPEPGILLYTAEFNTEFPLSADGVLGAMALATAFSFDNEIGTTLNSVTCFQYIPYNIYELY